jgi:hypothetical protein
MDLSVKSHVNREKAQRSVPMRCLALGMPRTGTNCEFPSAQYFVKSLNLISLALRDALKILGLNECYHQATLIQNPEDGILWTRAFQRRGTQKAFGRREWDALLGHCQAVCDIPAVNFCEELIETYPDARIILTSRDVDEWYQ